MVVEYEAYDPGEPTPTAISAPLPCLVIQGIDVMQLQIALQQVLAVGSQRALRAVEVWGGGCQGAPRRGRTPRAAVAGDSDRKGHDGLAESRLVGEDRTPHGKAAVRHQIQVWLWVRRLAPS